MNRLKLCGCVGFMAAIFALGWAESAAGQQACDSKCRKRFNFYINSAGAPYCLRYDIETCYYCSYSGKDLCKPVTADGAPLPSCNPYANENIAYYVDDCEPLCPISKGVNSESTVISGGTLVPLAVTHGKCELTSN